MSRSQFAIDIPDALVARARTGCREAFEQIYRRFERPVFTLALRICGDREEAGDVLQDTMLKLFHHLPDYRADCPFWGWLRQIAVNEALLRLRRQKRLVAEISVEEDDLPPDQGLPPRPRPTPRCCSAHWKRYPRRPAACCGSTTPRATPMRRSPGSCSARRASPNRRSPAARAGCGRC